MSSSSSIGPPVRTLAEPSSIGSASTSVLRSSASVAGRATWLRPASTCSTITSKAWRFSSSSSTLRASPSSTTDR